MRLHFPSRPRYVSGRPFVIRADRSRQYTSHARRQRNEDAEALASYAQTSNPYNNAQTEASWSILKTELLPHSGAFASLGKIWLRVHYYLDATSTSIAVTQF